MVKDILKHIDSLKLAFDKLKPLTAENQQKLDKKFRLEWNYNSNHIEGNTLTYGETELLLIFGETKGNHEFREYEEMKGHDVALKLLEDLAADKERNLSENFIREINKVILKEPFYKEAITQDGQPTRRLIKIGEYKSHPNSVRLQNGEMFHYASPAETPAAMSDLLEWYNEAVNNNSIHPIELAAELHYKFVCIHPFDDGNGRISRLIMNYHLLKNGYPPVIIKSADKKNYLFALHEADTGNLSAFKEYIAEQLTWSCEISIRAAKGESIDEAGDWEKKITLLSQNTPNSIEQKKSPETLAKLFSNQILDLIKTLFDKWPSINNLFLETTVEIKINKYGGTSELKGSEISSVEAFFNQLSENKQFLPDLTGIIYRLKGFKKNGKNAFNLEILVIVKFFEYYYSIGIKDQSGFKLEKFYHEVLSETDKEIIANNITNIIISVYDLSKNITS